MLFRRPSIWSATTSAGTHLRCTHVEHIHVPCSHAAGSCCRLRSAMLCIDSSHAAVLRLRCSQALHDGGQGQQHLYPRDLWAWWRYLRCYCCLRRQRRGMWRPRALLQRRLLRGCRIRSERPWGSDAERRARAVIVCASGFRDRNYACQGRTVDRSEGWRAILVRAVRGVSVT